MGLTGTGWGTEWTVVMKLAELICHECGAVTHTDLPTYRVGTMPRCSCGGRSQVVRIVGSRPGEPRPTRLSDSEQTAAPG